MVKMYKVMRTDSKDVSKLPLLMGHNLIGRQKILKCDDHRVSRNHGALVVSDDGLVLKALSVNPCFYKAKRIEGVQLLHQYSKVSLEDGDRFGLLPDRYWFKVFQCEVVSKSEQEEDCKDDIELQLDEEEKYKEKSLIKTQTESDDDLGDFDMNDNSVRAEGAESPSLIEPCNTMSTNEDTMENYLSNNEESRHEASTSHVSKKLVTDNMPPDHNARAFDDTCDPNNESNMFENEANKTNDEARNQIEHSPNPSEKLQTDNPSSPEPQQNEDNKEDNNRTPKRNHDDEEPEIEQKKIKLEPEIEENKIKLEPEIEENKIKLEPEIVEKKVKLEQEDVKPVIDPNVEPGTSNQSPADTNDKNALSPQKPVNVAPRERCIYGVNCYRKNVLHRQEFSHPDSADWGAGERGQCPWGRACRRRDPRHWQHHDHPPGVAAPGIRRLGRAKSPKAKKKMADVRRKKKRGPSHGSSGSDEGIVYDSSSEDEEALIVTGKRQRKQIRVSNDCTESESEADPFQTDESDEWQPSGVTKNQPDELEDD